MANTKISALTSATTPLAGTEVLPVVQSSATTQVSVANLTAGRAVSALSYASTTGATFATTSGSVGIGSTSVPDKLSVYGDTTGFVGIRATNNNATGVDKYINMFAGGTSTGITAWNNSGVIESAVGTNLVLSGYNGTTIFQTGTSRTERMRITSAGDVGIGITPVSPAKLEIKQSAATQQGTWVYASANDSHARLFCDGTSVGLAASFTSTGSYLPITFATSGATKTTLDTVGNLQMQAGAVMPYAPAPAAISAAATLTNANIQGQIISATGTTYTITMPLGSTLDTLASWATTNVSYDFFVINTATGIITMAVNTGVTSLGSLTVAIGASAHFRIRRTAASTYILYRLV